MFKYFLVFAFLALGSGSNPAPETVEGVLAANKKTFGSETAISAIETLTTFAHVKAPSSEYDALVVSSREGNIRFTRQYADRKIDMGIWQQGIWYIDPETGEKTEGPASYEFFIRGHEFHFEALFFDERFQNLSLVGPMKFQGCDCQAIHMNDAATNEVYIFFDPKNSKLRGFRKFREDEENMITMDFLYEDWAKFGDLILPQKVTIFDGEDVYIYDFTEILINQAEEPDFLPD